MSTPGFVPRQDNELADRVIKLERRLRNVQQNVAGATVANGGVPLSSTTPQPVGVATGGAAPSSSRSDHVHSGTLAAQQDVAVSAPAAGHALQYNGTAWANSANLSPTGHTLGVARPAEHSLVAWAFDPADCAGGQQGAGGTLYLSAVYVAGSATVTKVYWGNNTAGSGATASQNYVGLYNSAGTLLTSTGVDASVTASVLVTTTIASQSLAPNLYWVGFLFNATTMPAVYRAGFLNAQLVNAGISAAGSYRFATNGSALATLPGSITPGSNVASNFTFWAAIG